MSISVDTLIRFFQRVHSKSSFQIIVQYVQSGIELPLRATVAKDNAHIILKVETDKVRELDKDTRQEASLR